MVFLWIVNLLVMADIRSWFYRASDTVRTADKVCLTIALLSNHFFSADVVDIVIVDDDNDDDDYDHFTPLLYFFYL